MKRNKSDNSQAEKCKLLHRNIMGGYYEIFWTKTSVPYLMKKQPTQGVKDCKTNKQQTTNKQTQNKLEWECRGRVFGHSLI